MRNLKGVVARLRPGFLGVVMVLALLLVACAAPIENNTMPPADTPTDPMAGEEVEILMAGSQFSPQELTIPAGTTVLWYNDDTLPHTVTSNDGAVAGERFDAELDPGESFSYTFEDPGTYTYYCALHAGMVGEITVE
jgi:plastocyanin